KVRKTDLGDVYPATSSTPVYGDLAGSPDSWGESMLLTSVTITDANAVSYMNPTVTDKLERTYLYGYPPPGGGSNVFADGRASSYTETGLFYAQSVDTSYNILETSVTSTVVTTDEETGSTKTEIATGQNAEALDRLPWYEPV